MDEINIRCLNISDPKCIINQLEDDKVARRTYIKIRRLYSRRWRCAEPINDAEGQNIHQERKWPGILGLFYGNFHNGGLTMTVKNEYLMVHVQVITERLIN